LVREDADRNLRPAWTQKKDASARMILLSALDERVLGAVDVEPWFAKFYSYLITKELDFAAPGGAGAQWADNFNRDLYGDRPSQDPFNKDKYTGLRRWFRYAGLGWHDFKDNFIPCPYERLTRKLAEIFGKSKKLDANSFMERLASQCPELDGGEIFNKANPNYQNERKCTRALSSALRDLHDDRIIRLVCPADSRGWNLERAGSVRNLAQELYSDVFDYVELVEKH